MKPPKLSAPQLGSVPTPPPEPTPTVLEYVSFRSNVTLGPKFPNKIVDYATLDLGYLLVIDHEGDTVSITHVASGNFASVPLSNVSCYRKALI